MKKIPNDDDFYLYVRDFEKEAELSHSSYLSERFKAKLARKCAKPNHDPLETKSMKKNERHRNMIKEECTICMIKLGKNTPSAN